MNREEQINIAVADAVGWDDRKQLADVFQNHMQINTLNRDLYEALIDVAQWGARRVAENLIEEVP